MGAHTSFHERRSPLLDHAMPAAPAVAALALLGLAACGGAEEPCESAYRREEWANAVTACRARFERTGAPRDGIRLAQASDYVDDLATSAALARRLTPGPEAARAHRLLAESERRGGALAAAATHAATALVLHSGAGDDREAARDAYALAGVLATDGAYQAALVALELTRDAAVRSRDRRMQGMSELGRGDLLRLLGNRSFAERAYETAGGLLAPFCDRSYVLLKQGVLEAAYGQTTLARQALERALAAAPTCGQPGVVTTAHAQLAWLAWRAGDVANAQQHVAAIPDGEAESHVLTALIALQRGDDAGALAAFERAEARTAPEASWRWLAPTLRAQAEEQLGRAADAEVSYRRAMAAVARVRAASPAHAAYVAASHRMPHEGLIGLLASQGRWREVLAVIVDLDAGDMLRVHAAPGLVGADGVAAPAGAEHRAIATVPAAGAEARTLDGVLAAWRDRDLSIVVAPSPRTVGSGRDRVWRLEVRGGQVTGADVGPASAADALAERLIGDPRDREAAAALGAMLVPAGAGVLHVLPVGRIARAPLAALRAGDDLVVARRPLVRVLGLAPRTVGHRGPRTGAVVVGDPRRDLASAAAEARWVAGRLGTRAWLGPDATVERLLGAGSADVLHVAAHADERAGRRVIHLADLDVAPGLVVSARVAPRLVVLASCGSAASHDEGGWGSLAAAFVAAGSDHVVATQWSVDDAATAELVRRFYDAGGVASPAAALATAQAAMAAGDGTAWAAFTVVASPPSLASSRSPGASPGR
jgi:tetratricopeptide (TPR) repeat protein